MSITYSVRTGDTFEAIARRQYGTEQLADLIAQANPGALEPLAAGTALAIPVNPSAPANAATPPADASESEVGVLIDGQRFRFWEAVRVTRSIDAVDSVEFVAPFEPSDAAFREVFRPFSFKRLEVTVGPEQLFTGTLVTVDPVTQPDRRTVEVAGYSLPGVLQDCAPSPSAYPIEFNNQRIGDIAARLCAPFGLAVQLDSDQGDQFGRVAISPGQRVMQFLSKLAEQRNLIIGSTADGKLLFRKSAPVTTPVAALREGASPLVSVAPTFNPQSYYSHVTGIKPTLVGGAGQQYTAKNQRLEGVTRPISFQFGDAETGTLSQAANAKLGRMFGTVASYSVTVSTWRDPSGNLWAPNTTVRLSAPGAMVYNDYDFIVRSVEFSRSSESETARLNLVIPGAFSGELPETLPWQG